MERDLPAGKTPAVETLVIAGALMMDTLLGQCYQS